MTAPSVADQAHFGTSQKWNNLVSRSATAHRQVVAAEQEVHPETFVHEPETGLNQHFVSRDFHSSALDFQPLYATSSSACLLSHNCSAVHPRAMRGLLCSCLREEVATKEWRAQTADASQKLMSASQTGWLRFLLHAPEELHHPPYAPPTSIQCCMLNIAGTVLLIGSHTAQ